MYIRRIARLVTCIAALIMMLAIAPRPVAAEEIKSFDTDIRIEDTGMISVTERIVYDFGNLERHGIFRTIPYVKENEQGELFELDITGIAVEDEAGNSRTFVTSRDGEEIEIKIGDADITITGEHTYVIRYVVSGALTYFSDHDELYWNVTGDEWEVPIYSASSRVSLPQSPEKTSVRLVCFTGPEGSTRTDCTTEYADGNAVFAGTGTVNGGEGMTIVFGFPKDIVAHLPASPASVSTRFSRWMAAAIAVVMMIAGIAWYVLAPLAIIISWWKYGRDPKPPMGVTSAWFSPPQTGDGRDLTPAETGTLVDEEVSTREVVATIVDLARRGYVNIVENKKNDIELVRLEDKKAHDMEPHEKKLLDGLFSSGTITKIRSTSIAPTIESVKKSLYQSVVDEGFFARNPDTQRTLFYVVAAAGLFTGNFLLGIIAFLFGRAMPKKTILGAQQAAVATSLKNFLKSQERQLEYQAKNQMFFEKLLPYAVAFGVEKEWAKRFKDVDLTQPSWYTSSSGARVFNSMVLADSISSVTKAATPTSSSSGFSSGFSGGSSGGGGGGGGGGSW